MSEVKMLLNKSGLSWDSTVFSHTIAAQVLVCGSFWPTNFIVRDPELNHDRVSWARLHNGIQLVYVKRGQWSLLAYLRGISKHAGNDFPYKYYIKTQSGFKWSTSLPWRRTKASLAHRIHLGLQPLYTRPRWRRSLR